MVSIVFSFHALACVCISFDIFSIYFLGVYALKSFSVTNIVNSAESKLMPTGFSTSF